MTQVNVSNPNDGLGDKLRAAFIIVNENFSSIGDIVSVEYISATLSTYSTIEYVDEVKANLDNSINDLGLEIDSLNSTIETIEIDINSIELLVAGKASLTQLNDSVSNINNTISTLTNVVDNKIEEAPIDGFAYVRRNGSWIKLNDLI